MDRSRRTLIVIWLATAVATGIVAALVYRSLTALPEYGGRTDPAAILDDPTLLFEEPGILGSAVEMQATEAVRRCMREAGFDYRSPAPAQDLGRLAARTDGYGIATAAPDHRAELGPGGSAAPGYEMALYGAVLDDAEVAAGCAAAGEAALAAAVDALGALPYSLAQLELDAAAHPAYVQALQDWSTCMAGRGYDARTPEELIVGLVNRLRLAAGDEARALADEERRTAADDFACRARTIDRALPAVAAELAPTFVEANRPQLEALLPVSGDVDLPPGLGSGDVQVTAVWTGDADIDLFVTDPAGDRVYYNNPTVPSGGNLDRDARFPCGDDDSQPAAENVFWPEGTAPAGTYQVVIAYTSDCSGEGAQLVELVIQVNGRVIQQVSITLDFAGDEHVTGFEVTG